MKKHLPENSFILQIVDLLQAARQQVLRTVNQAMVLTYFEMGRIIVEEEQNGNNRAEYGKQMLKGLSEKLTQEFGKGFSVDNLEKIRRFYLVYAKSESVSRILETDKSETLSRNLDGTQNQEIEAYVPQSLVSFFTLSWSHYNVLMRIENDNERSFYEVETAKNNWSVRELKRQYDTALYTRLALSKDKDGLLTLAQKGQIIEQPKDIIKDPYILEFLGLPELHQYSESELEQEIINKLEHFLLELGNGFAFIARQKRISFDDKHFRIDLVFYNRLLKCFVLIDLKIGELKHQDLGQMQMYVNYYDREMRLEDENKTIGIVLCQNKSESLVEYTLPENNEQIFASKYKTVLPSKDDLIAILSSD